MNKRSSLYAASVSAHAWSLHWLLQERCGAAGNWGLQEHLVALMPMQRAQAQLSLFVVDDAYRTSCTGTLLPSHGALLTAAVVRAAGPMRESLCGSAALPALEAVRVLGAAPAPGLRARLEVLDARALHGARGPDQALPALRQAALAALQARPWPHKAAACSCGRCRPV